MIGFWFVLWQSAVTSVERRTYSDKWKNGINLTGRTSNNVILEEAVVANTFTIKRGDTSPSIQAQLDPPSVVLTGASVLFKMRPKGAAITISAPATIVTATDTPTVKYDWTASDTSTSGQFEAEFEVTFANGSVETFPNSGYIRVIIPDDIR